MDHSGVVVPERVFPEYTASTAALLALVVKWAARQGGAAVWKRFLEGLLRTWVQAPFCITMCFDGGGEVGLWHTGGRPFVVAVSAAGEVRMSANGGLATAHLQRLQKKMPPTSSLSEFCIELCRSAPPSIFAQWVFRLTEMLEAMVGQCGPGPILRQTSGYAYCWGGCLGGRAWWFDAGVVELGYICVLA